MGYGFNNGGDVSPKEGWSVRLCDHEDMILGNFLNKLRNKKPKHKATQWVLGSVNKTELGLREKVDLEVILWD